MDTSVCYVCKSGLNAKLKGDTDTNVCLKCRKEGDLFMSKTAVKKEYLLGDEDLDDVFSMRVHSHTYGRSQYITLYLIREIVDKANEKYGNFEEYKRELTRSKENKARIREEKKEISMAKREGVMRELFNRNNLRYRLDDTLEKYLNGGFGRIAIKTVDRLEEYIIRMCKEEDESERRRLMLCRELTNRGLNFREDSKICEAYIDGGIEEVQEIDPNINDLNDIVNIMEEMSFYHKKTNYKSLLGTMISKNRNRDREYYDREDISDISYRAKRQALDNFINKNKNNYMDLVPKHMVNSLPQIKK